jgi:hypothetical protein
MTDLQHRHVDDLVGFRHSGVSVLATSINNDFLWHRMGFILHPHVQ